MVKVIHCNFQRMFLIYSKSIRKYLNYSFFWSVVVLLVDFSQQLDYLYLQSFDIFNLNDYTQLKFPLHFDYALNFQVNISDCSLFILNIKIFLFFQKPIFIYYLIDFFYYCLILITLILSMLLVDLECYRLKIMFIWDMLLSYQMKLVCYCLVDQD